MAKKGTRNRMIFVGIYDLAEDTPEPEAEVFGAAVAKISQLMGNGAMAGKFRINVPQPPLDKLSTEYEVIWGETPPNLAKRIVSVKLAPEPSAPKPGPSEFAATFKKIKTLMDGGVMAGEDVIPFTESHQGDNETYEYDLEWGQYPTAR